LTAHAANAVATVLVLTRRAQSLGSPALPITPNQVHGVRDSVLRYEQLRTRAYMRHALARAYAAARDDTEVALALRGIDGSLEDHFRPEASAVRDANLQHLEGVTVQLAERYLELTDLLGHSFSSAGAILASKPPVSGLLSSGEARLLEDLLMHRAGLRIVWNEVVDVFGSERRSLIGQASQRSGFDLSGTGARIRDLDNTLMRSLEQSTDEARRPQHRSAFLRLRQLFFSPIFLEREALRPTDQAPGLTGYGSRLVRPDSLLAIEDLPLGLVDDSSRWTF